MNPYDCGDQQMTEFTFEAGGARLARVRRADTGVLAVALHAGHALRPSLEPYLELPEDERLREEDPFTAGMAPSGIGLVEVLRSRFEVDLNRPRFRSVYQGPKDAWGLNVWRGELPDAQDRISRSVYDSFYALMFDELSRLAERHRRFVVLDLHSYNHRREGPDAPPAASEDNPEVNLGTRRIDREGWSEVIEAFSEAIEGRGFDVRENVKFGGGHFVEWVAKTFPTTGCALAVEFKKTYMDEWTGEADTAQVARIRAALSAGVEAVQEVLAGSR